MVLFLEVTAATAIGFFLYLLLFALLGRAYKALKKKEKEDGKDEGKSDKNGEDAANDRK